MVCTLVDFLYLDSFLDVDMLIFFADEIFVWAFLTLSCILLRSKDKWIMMISLVGECCERSKLKLSLCVALLVVHSLNPIVLFCQTTSSWMRSTIGRLFESSTILIIPFIFNVWWLFHRSCSSGFTCPGYSPLLFLVRWLSSCSAWLFETVGRSWIVLLDVRHLLITYGFFDSP
jgi:hypothetical protein